MPVMPPPITRIFLHRVCEFEGLGKLDLLHLGERHLEIVRGHHLNTVELKVSSSFCSSVNAGKVDLDETRPPPSRKFTRSTTQPSN